MRCERQNRPLLSREAYIKRQVDHLLVALVIISSSLLPGMAGDPFIEGSPRVDALLNSAMLPRGMKPVEILHTNAGEVFALIYALYLGIVFLVVAGVLVTPVFHRMLHRFHQDMDK